MVLLFQWTVAPVTNGMICVGDKTDQVTTTIPGRSLTRSLSPNSFINVCILVPMLECYLGAEHSRINQCKCTAHTNKQQIVHDESVMSWTEEVCLF